MKRNLSGPMFLDRSDKDLSRNALVDDSIVLKYVLCEGQLFR